MTAICPMYKAKFTSDRTIDFLDPRCPSCLDNHGML